MENEIYSLKNSIKDIEKSLEALEVVRVTSIQDTWKAIDTLRLESHVKIHDACIDVQRADNVFEEAQYAFDKQFEKETERLDGIVGSITEAQSKAEVKLTATKLAFDYAGKEYEDAKYHFQCVKEAHDAAVNARSVLDTIKDEADALK